MEQPQLNVPIDTLPENVVDLFDASRSLSREVSFLPFQTDQGMFIINALIFGLIAGGAFGGSGIFGLIVMTGSILSGEYQAREFIDILLFIVAYLVLIGLVWVGWNSFWRPLWYEMLALGEKNAHQLRRGLFLTPNALVVRMKTNRCDVLPRETIVKAELRGGFRSRRSLYIIYGTPEGRQKTYDLAGALSWSSIDHLAALSHVQTWLEPPTEDKKQKRKR